MLPLLRTVVDIPQSSEKITYSSNIMFIGSCFTEEIGEKLTYYLFNTDINPFGILYNPASVAQSLEILMQKRLFSANDLQRRGNIWFSFYHHSRFSSDDKEQTLENINSRISFSHQFLKDANFLFITFGTAWVYVLKQTGKIVSNCHKLPQKLFERKLLEPEEIVQIFSELLEKLWQFNPKLKVIFTVSPVRHWKDGATGNQVSKSILIFAIHKLIEKYPQLGYFPSYEIIMDELRDYRFYADDMIHIGSSGVDYIWFRFRQTFFDETMLKAMDEVEKILKARDHRPKNKNTLEYKQFIDTTIEKIMLLRKNYPYIKIDQVLNHFIQERELWEKNQK